MGDPAAYDAELIRMVRNLRRARRAFIDAVVELGPEMLEQVLDESGWTVRRLIEYTRATERFHFTRMYHFFNSEDVKIFDSPAASLDHIHPADTGMSLAAECSQVWLAGRETEMWIDLIIGEDLDLSRPPSAEWPRGGWTIRGVFRNITSLYREKTRTLASL